MNESYRMDIKKKSGLAMLGGLLVGAALLLMLMLPLSAQAGYPPGEDDFVSMAPQGFGDRQNSWPWSMQWWNGYLYVGTNRAWHCAETASFHNLFPGSVVYPPDDPDIECPEDPEDIPAQAEIWRWSPVTNIWQRVYQSPNDVLLPSGKYTSRDIGFRGMTVYTETDGTEALYVTGVAAKFINFDGARDMPPPRILRTTDGVNWEAVPQNPGTGLGDFPWSSLRNPFVDKGRLYVIGGFAQGSGVLLESDDPSTGDDSYGVVSAWGMLASAGAPYNNQLYVASQSLSGYKVFRTDNSGSAPYTYTQIINNGGYLDMPNNEILSMQEFGGRLYAGGNGVVFRGTPAELIRINPDDTWDIVVGDPRETPTGWKYPLSGFSAGFGNDFNGHMWRLETYEDNLFVGTFDSSTVYKDDPTIEPIVRDLMGFDLWRMPDATEFYSVTTQGFGDKFNFGVRSMEATPYGLFVGAANYYYGLQIWQAAREHHLFMPSVVGSGGSRSGGQTAAYGPRMTTNWRSHVETAVTADGVVVSWEQAGGAVRYRVMRAPLVTLTTEQYPSLETDLTGWGKPAEVGVTTDAFFKDTSAEAGQQYVYFVEAYGSQGEVAHSNVAPAPSMKPPATFDAIAADVADYAARSRLSDSAAGTIQADLAQAQASTRASDYTGALATLDSLQQELQQPDQTMLSSWEAEDLGTLLSRLTRQLTLIKAGALPADSL
ncbi:MAG: hypothetical protein KDH90_13790 [Anaerolineae bacterium]|nr:hypothetical protein [Anaerolineae bacterium]